jgi:hypothetical protein
MVKDIFLKSDSYLVYQESLSFYETWKFSTMLTKARKTLVPPARQPQQRRRSGTRQCHGIRIHNPAKIHILDRTVIEFILIAFITSNNYCLVQTAKQISLLPIQAVIRLIRPTYAVCVSHNCFLDTLFKTLRIDII